jgi:hypothetical protein
MVVFLAYIVDNVLVTVLSGKAVYPDMTWNTAWSFIIPLIIFISAFIIYAILAWIGNKKTKLLLKYRYPQSVSLYESLISNFEIYNNDDYVKPERVFKWYGHAD